MNRAEATRQVLLLEAAARQCKAQAKVLRDHMETAALKELETEGTRPTWELRDIGTWTLPLSHEEVYVADEAALLAWVKEEPSRLGEVIETVERVKPWYRAEVLRMARITAGRAVGDDGEPIPGLAVRPGGIPQTLSFRAASDAKAVADQHADALVERLREELGIDDA